VNKESIFEVNYDGLLDPGAGSVHTLFSLPADFPAGTHTAHDRRAVARESVRASTPAARTGHSSTSPSSMHSETPPSGPIPGTLGPAFIKYLDQTDFQNMHQRPGSGSRTTGSCCATPTSC